MKKTALFFFTIFCALYLHAESNTNTANNKSSMIINAEISGITIINGNLWIDGEYVAPQTTYHRSPASGKMYKISWKSDNKISVSEISK